MTRYQLYVSAVPDERVAVLNVIKLWTIKYAHVVNGATVSETTGYWDGKQETGLSISVDAAPSSAFNDAWDYLLGRVAGSLPSELYGWRTEQILDKVELVNFVDRRKG